ncbi:hypothetical protein, partial [Aquiflexum sp.]|uniref:hypothetical protein n=1 Tax=Aquiflexum sp. TaxID=1872584 RepID=UPI0035945A07
MNITSKAEYGQPIAAPTKTKEKSTKKQQISLFKIFRPFLKIWIKIFKFTIMTFIEILRAILRIP